MPSFALFGIRPDNSLIRNSRIFEKPYGEPLVSNFRSEKGCIATCWVDIDAAKKRKQNAQNIAKRFFKALFNPDPMFR